MIYRILHDLFGWDYIHWKNSADQGVSRVRKLPDGSVGYWRYLGFKIFDVIEQSSQVLWLTCHPSKYFPEDKTQTSTM